MESQPSAEAGTDELDWRKALSWASYDLANTIYSAVVVSFAIALHAKEFTGVERYTFATFSLSMLASGLFVPFAGELTDRTGRAKGYLVISTLVCCASCAAISWAFWAPLIFVFYFVANFSYQTSLAFYDSLLPVVAPEQKRGLVSGLGVGLGYGGTVIAVPAAIGLLWFYRGFDPVHELRFHFVLAAGLFLVGSLPLFLWVPERPARKEPLPGQKLLRLSFRRTMVTLRALPRHPAMLYFLLGNFLCVDALNAAIGAYAPYTENVLGLGRREILLWMIPFSVSALLLGILSGRLSDRFGAGRVMLSAAGGYIVAVVVCGVSSTRLPFYGAFILFGGYGLSTIWVAGRKMLLDLCPPGQVGKYFGLYNVGHKLSMVGILLFGLLADVDVPGLEAGGYRAGLLIQVVTMAAGAACILKSMKMVRHGRT